MLHSFDESLHKSQQRAEMSYWPTIHRKRFPNLVSCKYVKKDGYRQRRGIDRIIKLKNGQYIFIDEMDRDKNYPDLLFEQYSDTAKRTPGKIEKNILLCDFFAYNFLPEHRCYFFVYEELRRFWLRHKDYAIQRAEQRSGGFRVIWADNEKDGYQWVTKSIAVPFDFLLPRIEGTEIIDW